jgi:hypothetical protein
MLGWIPRPVNIETFIKRPPSLDSISMQARRRSHNVPEAPQLDRLLRYEASLERAIDRTLTQLERLQRMRLGQPVS